MVVFGLISTLCQLVAGVLGQADSVNLMVIVLPAAGIILVGLFAVFCICRYTCRFISFCTKLCENSQKDKKPVTIVMPTRNSFHDVFRTETSELYSKASAPELDNLLQNDFTDAAQRKSGTATLEYQDEKKSRNSVSEKKPCNNLSETKTVDIKTDKNNNRATPTKESLIQEKEMRNINDANNEISEISAPQITITVY